MLLAELAATSRELSETSSRLRKVELIAAVLRDAEPEEVLATMSFLAGELRQRRTGVGWASLRSLPAPATESTLTVSDVDAAFEAISIVAGKGSAEQRRALLEELFAAATDSEQAFLAGLARGELRQGALESLVVDALAKAAGLPAADVRRAVMLRGSPGPVAVAILAPDVDKALALKQFRLEVGRPVQPMLAQSASTVTEAVERLGRSAVEWKLDGIRVQIHRDGDDIRIFTRTLDDVTQRLPEIVDVIRALPVGSAVLDGEVLALRGDGRPRPFQVTASRVGSRVDVVRARGENPLSLFVFDALLLDGRDLLDLGYEERHDALAAVLPPGLLVPRVVVDDPADGEAFAVTALAAGHEGVVVKAIGTTYDAGRRGAGWVKVKPVHTLDLVVLAVEWGSGRRKGWLSNLHLGARDPETGGYVMLGKTFKGLTDELLRWQTEALLALATDRGDWVVTVRPELVVEIAFDGVQTSSRYPGGMALRFARVVRYRPDKPASQASTVDEVRALHTP